MLHLIGIAGQAGSGKTTFSEILSNKLLANEFVLADPIKVLAELIFKFKTEDLYGKSENRKNNYPDFSFSPEWDDVKWAINNSYEVTKVLAQIFPNEDLVEIRRLFIDKLAPLKAKALATKTLNPREVIQCIGTEFGRSVNQNTWINHTFKQIDKSNSASNIISDLRFRNEIESVKKNGGTIIKIFDPGHINTDPHVSELEMSSLPDYWFDVVFENHKNLGINWLENKVDQIITQLTQKSTIYIK